MRSGYCPTQLSCTYLVHTDGSEPARQGERARGEGGRGREGERKRPGAAAAELDADSLKADDHHLGTHINVDR